eukprot:1181248-Prorocentrum_minimum.AAC.1
MGGQAPGSDDRGATAGEGDGWESTWQVMIGGWVGKHLAVDDRGAAEHCGDAPAEKVPVEMLLQLCGDCQRGHVANVEPTRRPTQLVIYLARGHSRQQALRDRFPGVPGVIPRSAPQGTMVGMPTLRVSRGSTPGLSLSLYIYINYYI